MSNGEVAQQGVHQSLLGDEHGAYYKLVKAQQLSIAPAGAVADRTDDVISPDYEGIPIEKRRQKTIPGTGIAVFECGDQVTPESNRGTLSGFSTLMMEQKANWLGYIIMIVAAMCAAGKLYRSSWTSATELH